MWRYARLNHSNYNENLERVLLLLVAIPVGLLAGHLIHLIYLWFLDGFQRLLVIFS